MSCLLYIAYAADDSLRLDLGVRRFIKKIDKNKKATDEILENKKQEIASKAMT